MLERLAKPEADTELSVVLLSDITRLDANTEGTEVENVNEPIAEAELKAVDDG